MLYIATTFRSWVDEKNTLALTAFVFGVLVLFENIIDGEFIKKIQNLAEKKNAAKAGLICLSFPQGNRRGNGSI